MEPAALGGHAVVRRFAEMEQRLAELELQLAEAKRPQQAKALAYDARKVDDYQSDNSETDSSDSSDESQSQLTGEQMLRVTAKQLDNDDSYVLNESIWDCALFVGLESMGTAVSVFLVVLIVLNAVTQFVFLLIVKVYMTKDDNFSEETLLGLLRFRTSVAHDIRYADHATYASLAAQVCEQDKKLPWAGAQLGVLDVVEEFMPPNRVGALALCVLAMACWLTTMTSELQDVFSFTRALLAVPRSRVTRIMRERGDDAPPTLQSINFGRVITVLLLVVLPRVVIGILLLFGGCNFLCFTTSFGDLLLNAMALAFIVDIDELFYKAFAPVRLKLMVRDFKPLVIPRKDGTGSRCPAGHGWVKLIFVTLMVAGFYFKMLLPFHARIELADKILCSGERHFVYALNPASGILEATRSFPQHAEHSTLTRGTVMNLVKLNLADELDSITDTELREEYQHLMKYTHTNVTLARIITSREAFKRSNRARGDIGDRWSGYSRSLVGDAFPPHEANFHRVEDLATSSSSGAMSQVLCENAMVAQTRMAFIARIQDLYPKRFPHRIPTRYSIDDICKSLKSECHKMHSTALRSLCPTSCGCNDEREPTAAFFASSHWGCPHSCEDVRRMQMRATGEARLHGSHRCVDDRPEAFLGNESTLGKYIAGAFEYLSSNPDFPLFAFSMLERYGQSMGINAPASALPSAGHNTSMIALLNASREADEEADEKGEETGEVPRNTVAGYMTSRRFLRAVQQGDWSFYPGAPHPRGKKGCRFWTSWEVGAIWGIDFCRDGNFRTLRFFCPVSCRCRAGMDSCPSNCPSPGSTAARLGPV